MKRILALMLAVMFSIACFSGCGHAPTEEELQAQKLAEMEAEEASTGRKRMTSVNLDLSEKEYQDLDIATKLISGHGGDIEMLLDGVVDCDWRPIDVNLKGVPQGLKSEY